MVGAYGFCDFLVCPKSTQRPERVHIQLEMLWIYGILPIALLRTIEAKEAKFETIAVKFWLAQ